MQCVRPSGVPACGLWVIFKTPRQHWGPNDRALQGKSGSQGQIFDTSVLGLSSCGKFLCKEEPDL